jgi:LysR family transcriptional regulator, hydrogen peroxide-inducible genes activator
MDLSQITLAQMRYAVAVEDSTSFRAAAAACSVSQSGLSMQLHKLEELLGVVLFDRSKKPVLVTPEGAPALLQMRTVLREMEHLGQLVSTEGAPSGSFRLAVIPTLSPTVVPLFLAKFLEACPKVELRMEELQTSVLIARLQAGTLDAAIAATPLGVPGLFEVSLGMETMLAYLSPGDPLLKAKRVKQQDLQDRQLWVMPEGHCFRTQVLSYCAHGVHAARHAQAPGRTHFESASFETLIRLVDAGVGGATVLPAMVAESLDAKRKRNQLRPFAGPPPVREIGLVTSRALLHKRVTATLIDILRKALGDALGKTPRDAQLLPPSD